MMPPSTSRRLAAWSAASIATWPALAAATELGAHHALHAAGPQAQHIAHLWDLMLAVCGVVFAAVLVALLYAMWRSRRAEELPATPDLSSLDSEESPLLRSVVWATGISTVLLVALIAASIYTDRALARLPVQDAVHIEVTAHQWWWEARYDNEDLSKVFTTANELHVPVGKPVILSLKADDVIHSFWVPNLAGKKDLIPGRSATLKLRADHAGVYRGQCAEFCGYQHALMAFSVVADEPQAYTAWLAAQEQPAKEPQDKTTQRGKQVFMRGNCAMCHAIQGTDALAMHAPDLTHIASRKSLAAGTLQNNEDNLRRWIIDPNGVKPGANMPPTQLPEEDLRALVAYLRSLT